MLKPVILQFRFLWFRAYRAFPGPGNIHYLKTPAVFKQAEVGRITAIGAARQAPSAPLLIQEGWRSERRGGFDRFRARRHQFIHNVETLKARVGYPYSTVHRDKIPLP